MHSIPGLTSKKVQKLLNGICKYAETYLEVGCYLGATAAAALKDNTLDAYFVDNWKDQVQSFNGNIDLPPNDKNLFIETVKGYKGNNTIQIFDCDMFEVDLTQLKPIDVFFYDADHNGAVTSKAIQYYSSAFADQCIMIIDDANFEGVIDGVIDGIDKAKLNVSFTRMILNDIENAEGWWNGLYILVVNK